MGVRVFALILGSVLINASVWANCSAITARSSDANVNRARHVACFNELTSGLQTSTQDGSFAARVSTRPDFENWSMSNERACATVREFRNEILRHAQELEINPIVLGAVVLAENTIMDQSDLVLERVGTMINSENIGRRSLGVTQIQVATFCDMYNRYSDSPDADCSNRTELTRFAQWLTRSRDWPIWGTAAYLRYSRNLYQQALPNIELDSKVGLLTTLYNLGNPAGRRRNFISRRESDPSAEPQMNLYGLFAESNRALVNQLLNTSRDPVTTRDGRCYYRP